MKRQAPMLALLALIGGLALTTPASASDYSGNCANVTSFNGTGNVSITDTACALPQDITATGSISISATSITGGKAITANGGNVTVSASGGNITLGQVSSHGGDGNVTITATNGDLTVDVVNSFRNTILSGKTVKASTITAIWGVQVTATDGTLDLADITSNSAGLSAGGNILLSATGNIKAGNLKNNGTSTTGGIEIHANTAGTSTAFKIGGGGTNGTGVLNVSNTTGGGSSPGFMPAGVYVTNGNTSSTGGITVSSMSSLLLSSSGGRAGILILDAKSGTLTLPTGTLNADGASGFGAGSIYLLANTLTTANGTIISASQTDAAAATYHYVQIAAATVNVAGASGLQIKADGNGVSQATASAGLIPKNSLTVTSTNDLNSLYWNVVNNAFATTGTITVAGSGPIKISSNGDYSRTMLIGNTITFSNSGTTTIEAKGKTSHEILVSYSGTTPTDLSFTGAGAVLLDSSATTGGSAGDINLYARNFITNTTASTLNANGPASGNGNAGNIFLNADNTTIGASTKMKFSAIGPTAGNGNGGNISVYPGKVAGGTLKLGTGSNNLQVLANAGSTGGNAGTIVIIPSAPDGNISIETANAVSAAASTGASANSKGGNIELNASSNFSVASSLSGAAIIVDGKGTGDAGTIKILGNGTLKLGSVAGALTLSAKALDTGNGGTIEIAYTTDLTISDTLSVAGGIATGSNGKGGTINIHDLGAFTTSAFITADGRGTGDGGTITISSSAFNQMKFNGATVSASADTNGSASASDNAVTILNAGEILMQNTFVNAIGAGSGDGGTIRIEVTSANSPKLDLNGLGTFINAFGGDDGLGGKFISGNVLTFPVPDVVTVRAGANKAISDFNGSITLNLVLCQQWKTPYAPSWPSVYWNCSNPTSPDADDEIHVGQAAGFISSIRTMMNSPSTHLFVFDDPMGYRRFFGKTTAEVPDAAGGHTFNLGNMIFTSVNRHFVALSGYRATTSIELTELSSHELTHAIDIRKSLQSHTATWINFVKNDFLTLDYSVVGTSAATSTKRPPCSTNNTGALDGVIDNNTFATFCDPLNPGQLKASYTVGGVTPSNSKLLLDAQEYIFAPVSGGFYMEIYAQAGAFEYYVHTLPPSLYVFPTADGIFARGYFACTRAWASAVLAGSFTPPASPASCSSVAPAWYIPQQ